MPRLKDVCRYVRSKNAGPFWVTVDLFFDGADSYAQYHADPAVSAENIAAIYGVDVADVKRFEVKSLNMIKISYPRTTPQGGVVERDMHSGQQFVPLLEQRFVEISSAADIKPSSCRTVLVGDVARPCTSYCRALPVGRRSSGLLHDADALHNLHR